MRTLFFTIILGLCLVTINAWPAGQETFGNKPLPEQSYEDWPGIMPLINNENRVYSAWENETAQFFFRGDTEAFNQFLALFAAMESPVHEVIFRPGPFRVNSRHNNRAIPADWQLLHVVGFIVLDAIPPQDTADAWNMHPTLTVYLTEKGRIQLDKVIVPEQVKVVQVVDLRETYHKALQSDNTRMHADAVSELAAVDHLNSENIPLIAQVLKDDDPYARTCAAVALGRFGALAKSALPELQEAAQSEDQRVSACARESIEKITSGPDLTDDIKAFRAMEEHIREFTSALPPSNQQK